VLNFSACFRIFGTAIACSSFLNLLVPGATMLHPTFLIMVRVLQGLVEVSAQFVQQREKKLKRVPSFDIFSLHV
jgi:hypothetical protein